MNTVLKVTFTHGFLTRFPFLTLQLNIQKVEELGSGAIYCQLFDSIYPGSINLSKVKWTAKHDYDYTHNFKLLQAGFDKFGHKKHIEVQKLIKGKYQDNLEFVQWMKALYDMKGGDNNGNFYILLPIQNAKEFSDF